MAGGRKRSETTLLVGGGRPNRAFASCLRGELLPQAATYPEQPPPPASSPAARSHPVPPRFIPLAPPPGPPTLIWEWVVVGGGTGWRASLWIVRLGLGLRENAHVQKW